MTKITSIHCNDGLLSWDSEYPLATKEQYELADRCIGSVFEALHPGEIIELEDGIFELDEDLDLKPPSAKTVLNQALIWGRKNYPSSPIEHHAAFANAVWYLLHMKEPLKVDHLIGGPSCRERAVITASGSVADPHYQFTFQAAAEFAAPWCYGLIQDLHTQMYERHLCFDDAPSDIEQIKKAMKYARQPLKLAAKGFCLVCQGELKPNNKSNICSWCQQNMTKARLKDVIERFKS
jgi:hypothetical protein